MASSSTPLRTMRITLAPLSRAIRTLSTYSPAPPADYIPARPPRPATPTFFTGKPTYHSAILSLSSAIDSAQSRLRKERIYPFPSHLPAPQPPRASWHPAPVLGNMLGTHLKTSAHRRVVELLNELHLLRHVADLSDIPAVAGELDGVLREYERHEREQEVVEAAKESKHSGIDDMGRAYGFGRRKESSARVWIVPSRAGQEFLSPVSVTTSPVVNTEQPASPPLSEILINHLPLPAHFPRPCDRESVLRPFRITGLLGAFNVFALVRGGGTSGQAGAVALAVARAVEAIRPDTKDVLFRDGALMRDTRMVERKKTGKAKARKNYTWVKR